ncbi:fused lipid transporter subunits of ABC superfamily: membrane component; ATP-binding component [Magnetospirillum gryphiswaldense MSR-1 v2]|uniref:Fused lipid transporter subunits of ABC superfamily: membrane component ATP-binding component n=1 Tax=Magnetospirillum gryphiswaldense (strain DSM 6361 / JCM 21280 / NBRC 15271 / MSR-1) TaxID=431944 RepID=V6EVQ7_MAGGM|nr:ABC transporter transmembrane domain-containing protein [Magnetospirillum gryphiswaldense]CDK97340.1 fused lipid transporter subunits of ABC superfamily: membrane component; ATP-binding component [Magnetospirillum gryphiswaldense MSR-1 v2]
MGNQLSKNKISLDLSSRSLMRRLIKEGMRPYLGKVVLAALCMGISAGATAGYALLMDPVINDIFVNKRADLLWPLALAVLGTFVAKSFAGYGEAVLLSKVGLQVIADMQNRLFRHLMRLDVQFFHDTQTGRILSRLTNDVAAMRFAVSNALTGLCKDAAEASFLIAAMFYKDWQLAAFSFLFFPIAVLPIARLGKRMRKVSANTQEQQAQLTIYLEQAIQGIRVVKAYGMEEYENRKVGGLVGTLRDLTFKAARVRSASSPIMEFLGGFAITVVIVYGGSRVIEGPTTPGAFLSFITALMLAYRPLKNLANLNTNLQEGLAAASRCFAVLDTDSTIKDRPGAQDLVLREGNVRFHGVFFTYDGVKAALDGVDMDIPGGKTVALVGPSGAGKSTILNLLPRFYDVTDGHISIDGADVRDVTMDSLRARISLVSQEIVLFDDTIRANIAYGRFGATDEEIEAAARAAAAHDFILSLPEGYDTMVGERGLNLSGGQRQRLAIARAMLKNAPILLLDEATSALDTESERNVQTALEHLMKGRTTIVIAHRLSTVVNADLIHVLDRGRVVESGDHNALLDHGGIYARLYAMQFAEETVVSGSGRGI